MTQNTITIPCEASLLPKPGDLTNIFNQIINSIAILELQGLPDEAQKIRDILDNIKDILGNYPISISDPVFATLEIPEVEWEKRINAMIEEYHLFVQAKFLEIINTVLPVSFAIPVPPFGISVDIVRLFSEPEYKSIIKSQFIDELETFYPMLPDIYKSFDGTYGIESPDMKAEAIWEYVITQLNKGALGIIYGLFGDLISKFDTIWEALGLPSLPALTELNVEGLINSTIESLEEQIKSAPDDMKEELRRQAIEQLESLNIAGFSVLDLIGGEPNDFVESLERKMDRFKRRLKNFGEEWPKYLIQEWMQKVQKFFNAIGLGALIEWITFTFCDFLKLIGFPAAISITNTLDIIGLKNVPSAALDENGNIIPAGEAGSNILPTLTPIAIDIIDPGDVVIPDDSADPVETVIIDTITSNTLNGNMNTVLLDSEGKHLLDSNGIPLTTDNMTFSSAVINTKLGDI